MIMDHAYPHHDQGGCSVDQGNLQTQCSSEHLCKEINGHGTAIQWWKPTAVMCASQRFMYQNLGNLSSYSFNRNIK